MFRNPRPPALSPGDGLPSFALTLVLGAAGYFALARLGLSLATLHASASPIWPASGLATALLVAFGARLWPAIAAGAFFANLLGGDPLTAAFISAGNTAEALLGQWLIRRFDSLSGDQFPIARATGFATAALFAPLASAGIGVGTLIVADRLGAASPLDVMITWCAGAALGILLLAPLLLALRTAISLPSPRYMALLAFATLAANGFAFLLPGWGAAIFLTLPIITLAVRWSGTIGAGFVVLLTSVLWLAGTLNGMGPFIEPSINGSLINMQVMLAPLAIAGLVLAEVRGTRPTIPAAVFLAGGLISCVIFIAVSETDKSVDARHMASVISRVEGQISDRMNLYMNALKGGASLFAASREVQSTEWAAYANALDLPIQFPGINGMGVVIPVDKRSADQFAAMMRVSLGRDFAIKPVPDVAAADAAFPQHFVIIYSEPIARNRRAIGLDVASEPRRRAAAIAARDTGQPALTAPITLLQDEAHRPGFLAFVPMYRDRSVTAGVNGSRGAFSGWIYAPFIAEAFFRNALVSEAEEVRLRIFDGPHADAANLVFDSAAALAPGKADQATTGQVGFIAEQHTTLRLYGREFTLAWQRSSTFAATSHRTPALYSAGITFFATLFAALVATLLSQRERATKIAADMNAALIASNDRFALAAACTQDGIWDRDLRTGKEWVSPRYAGMFGYTIEEVADLETFWLKVIAPEDVAPAQKQYMELLNGERDSLDLIQAYRHKDGSIIHVQTRGKAVRGADGKVDRVVGVHTDITPLILLEQQFRAAISVMEDGFGLFDRDDRVILCNEAFIDQGTRKSLGDPIGHTFEEIVRAFAYHDMPVASSDFDREAWIAQRMERHRNPPPEPLEVEWSGGRRMRISERRTSDGGYVGIWTDVTALMQAERRLEDAIESLNEGFVLIDKNGCYAAYNQRFLQLYPKTAPYVAIGARLEEALREGARAGEYPGLTTAVEIDAFVQSWIERYANPERQSTIAEMGGGEWRMISHHGTSDGGYVNIYSDITELKQREAALAQAKERLESQAQSLTMLTQELQAARVAAENANRSKSHFLANMSHELRTPLNGILGFAEIIKNEMFGTIEPRRYRDYGVDIYDSGKHLLTLINDLLDLSKIEADKMTLHIDAIETASVVRQAMRMVEKLAQERGVTLGTPDIAGCPVMHADETQARQILLNLLSNAVKFTPDSGHVSLRVQEDGEAGIVITVSDTGIGMTPDEIKTALERFGQAETSYSKSTPGTGLGLPLVEGLVKLHGGSLSIESEKDSGTTVTIRLPWHEGLYRQPARAAATVS